MQAPESFIVTPKDKRYKQGKEMGGVLFETTVSIEDAKDVSKEGVVISVPLNYKGEIKPGDDVIIHHNIFRIYYNQHGKMTYSRAYLYQDRYQAIDDEVFLYKTANGWKAHHDWCFVEPMEEDSITLLGDHLPHTGKVVYSNTHPVGEIIGFTPESEYEVLVDGKKLYRMRDKDVCLYERFI